MSSIAMGMLQYYNIDSSTANHVLKNFISFWNIKYFLSPLPPLLTSIYTSVTSVHTDIKFNKNGVQRSHLS